MNSKRWHKIFLVFSIIIFIFSILFFIYSLANKKYSSILEKENNRIKNQIDILNGKSNKLKKDINNVELDFNLKSQEFYDRYGYQFESNKSDEINKLINSLTLENKEIIADIKSEIKKYSNFYVSNIYEKENYDKSVDMFLNLNEDNNLEKFKNIYEELEIENLVKDSNGFISEIINSNEDSRELKILLYLASIYAYNLDNFEKDTELNYSNVFSSIYNLKFIYEEIVRKNYNVSSLNPKKLDSLINTVNEKSKIYYENNGIINSLKKNQRSIR